jgi:hypothetical protein
MKSKQSGAVYFFEKGTLYRRSVNSSTLKSSIDLKALMAELPTFVDSLSDIPIISLTRVYELS